MGATAHRNSFRSFEDHTQRISHSVYVTNFPNSVNSRDLWNSCSAYGTVIDVFISVKKSKARKRFAFVRPQKPYSPPNVKSGANIRPPGISGLHQSNVRTGSYADIVNGAPIAKNKNSSFLVFDLPALILDETCANDGDLSRHVMGRVKALNSIPNLKTILTKEVKSWFHELQDGTFDFVSNERIVWVNIEGIPLSVWSHATFFKIGKKWGELMDIEESVGSSFARKQICIKTNVAASILETFKVIFKGKTFMVHAKEIFTWTPCFLEYKESKYASDDELPHGMNNKSAQSAQEDDILVEDTDDEGVADTYFRDNSSPPICNGGNANDQEDTQHSEDPFGFYNLLKKPPASTVLESNPSLTHPLGYTLEPSQQEIHNDASVYERGNHFESPIQKESPPLVPNTAKDPSVTEPSSEFSTSFHSRKTHNGGLILDVLDDVIKVGQSMGYDMEGCSNDIERIISLQGVDETKMECISYMDVKFIWGNSNFQFVSSDSIGNSGGILCVWEQSIFKKDGATVSDNFIALYGTWLPTNTKILFVVIYAPQATVLKRTLWDYISTLANRWNGETIVLGDFNEVRSEEERFGSIFNQSSARAFNQFIASSGLIEVKMEGYSFTWSHPSASKMSKLDHFLVSDGIFLTFPSITAICLDRHLSDHRPIFLNEIHADFGLTPFRIIRFKKKLQGLKQIIRVWTRESNRSQERVKKSLVDGLVAIDKDLDMGINSDDMLLRRLELTQGDENSKYFHGIINKRRAQLGIRGIFINGLWTTEPSSVKKAFVDHFAYDSVRWDFILNVLQAYGFGSRWCSWIRGIFSYNMASILLNMSPIVEFPILSGLKQGDPLAPLLFILVMVSLHISISRAVNDGVFKGLHINDSTILSHLFYADDAIFLGEWSDDNLANLIRMLQLDFAKAYDSVRWDFLLDVLQAYGFGSRWCSWIRGEWSDDNLANLIRMLQCFQLASGLKINVHKSVTVGDQMSHHSAWRNIIQKVRTRLSKWKVKTLSIGGRLTLLKSVLGAVPLYSMSIYKAPKGVLHELEMIPRFTGLRLRITIQSVPRAGVLFFERFWCDSWLVDSPLCTRFPRMYALERNKEILVAVKWGDPLFNHSFRRQAREGAESQHWTELLSLLGTFTLSPSIDRWVSDLNGEGLFRVKYFHSFLNDLLLPSSNMATRWVKCVPVKVNVFVWRTRLERLPTRDNLAKRGVPIVSNLYPVYGSFPEDAHHLFFGCDLAKNIFLKICRWSNLIWAHVSSFVEWDNWFASIRLSSKLKSMLEGVLITSWWFIWSFRNRSIFEEPPTEAFGDV
ncbi:RNA-directed DNA polymerase, eukaryota [Tanacetum coccineum]